MTAAPPNVVLITSDQHRGDCFGFEGRAVKTPHLDRLAEEGARFSACTPANPICQPSRASVLTGLLPYTHGVYDNGIDLDQELARAGFAGMLTANDVPTGLVGKAHLSSYDTFAPTGRPEELVSSERYGPEWHGPYMGFGHVELVWKGHYEKPPPAPPRGLHYERFFHRNGHGAWKAARQFTSLPPDSGAPRTWTSALPSAWHNSQWTADRAIDYVERQRAQPFCLWVSFADPHPPFDAPEPWARMHDPADVDLPRRRELDLDRRPWWHRASLERDAAAVDPRLADPSAPANEDDLARSDYAGLATTSEVQLRQTIANYYGMISLVDHQVGRLLIALDELGLAERTLIVFTSDHGELLGDHGLYLKGPTLYEGLMRVGLICRGPGIRAGAVIDDPVSLLDVAPTILDAFGIVPPRPLHGRSLLPLLAGRERREYAYAEWYIDGRYGLRQPLDLRMVRTRTHKLTVDLVSGAGELYDLVDDPDEMDNRFESEAAAPMRERLMGYVLARPDDVRPRPPRVGVS